VVVQPAQERNAIKCVPVSAVDTAKEKPAKAKLPPLVATDATSKLIPMDVKAGDRALFGAGAPR
jgi:co-chaperonin GroES (HSP10)